MRKIFPVIFLVSLALAACGQGGSGKKTMLPTYDSCLAQGMLYYKGGCYPASGVNHTTNRFSLLAQASFLDSLAKEEIPVCVSHEDVNALTIANIQNNIEKAFREWTSHIVDLMPVKSHKLNFQVVASHASSSQENEILATCPENSDLKAAILRTISNADGEDREHAIPANSEIVLNERSDYAVIIHEMGHIFGLADIYVEDQWDCKKDFANSVMCNHEWEKPILDDIEAVRKAYCLATDGANPACFNARKDQLISFLPEADFRYGEKRQGAYLICADRDYYFALGFGIVSYGQMVNGEAVYGGGRFVSTDPASVNELSLPDLYQISVKTSFSKKNEVSKKTQFQEGTVIISLSPESIAFSIDSPSISLRNRALECTLDTRFMAYLKGKGFRFSDPAETRQEFNRLQAKAEAEVRAEYKATELSFPMKVDAKAPRENLRIKIFADDEKRSLLKTYRLTDVMQTLIEGSTEIYMIQLPSDHGLKAGTYHVLSDGGQRVMEILEMIVTE